MNVILEDELFGREVRSASLIAILHLGFLGQHGIQADPPWRADAETRLNAWIRRQDLDLQDELMLALEAGSLLDVSSGIPSDFEIRVGPGGMAVDAALAVLKQPLAILVEDFENDWLFVKLLAGAKWRPFLEDWEAKRWIQVQHGGGGRLMNQLEKAEPLRTWVLFDSDARLPGQPEPNSERIRERCRQLKLAHHQTRRRAAENYLPVPALEHWTRVVAKDKRQAYLIFQQLSFDQRCHFAMREGFAKKGDRKVDPQAEFFGKFGNHPWLMAGFGDRVRGLFGEAEFKIEEVWLRADDRQGEHADIYLGLLRSL